MGGIMRDFRLQENRMELFKDFYWFHTKYGIHSGLVQLYYPEITKGLTKEQKYWVTFLEGCIQNFSTVWVVFNLFPNRPTTEEEVQRFKDWHDVNAKRLDYDGDRRHFKYQLYKQLVKYNELIGDDSSKVFEEYLYDEDPKKWFTNVFEFIKNKVWGFGRTSTWNYCEGLKLGCGLNYEFNTYFMTCHDDRMSVRNGLLLLYGQDDMQVWKKLPNNPTKHPKPLMEWAEGEALQLTEYLRTQYTDIQVTVETVESLLCVYKGLLRGKRYPNLYVDKSYDRIKKAEKEWGSDISFDIFWDIRRNNLPKEILKEEAYNGYMNDGSESAVTKDKLTHFTNTGLPLFLDLFFDKYKRV